MKGLVVALLLLIAVPVQAQEPSKRVFDALRGAFLGLAVADGISTVICLETVEGCVEANPMVRPVVERHGARSAMSGKVAVNGAQMLAIGYLWRKYPDQRRQILLGTVAMVALQGYVVGHNLREMRKRGVF